MWYNYNWLSRDPLTQGQHMAQYRAQRRLAAILAATVVVCRRLMEVMRGHTGAPRDRLDLLAWPP